MFHLESSTQVTLEPCEDTIHFIQVLIFVHIK